MQIRKGGFRANNGHYQFELVGRPVLDLINTIDERKAGGRELLGDYGDLLDWSIQSQLITKAGARRLQRIAAARREDGRRALGRAKDVRENLFSIFSALVARRPPARRAIEAVNGWFAAAQRHRRLVSVPGGASYRYEVKADDLDQMLWPAIMDAAEFIVSEETTRRLRMCQGATCGWLFLDHSRRGDRKWCDMSVCGNRAKAARHYARIRRDTRRTQ